MPLPHDDLQVVVTDDGSRTFESRSWGQTYRSESGALAESRLVFLENSGVADRLRAGVATRVLEIGFGTGLNFWLTASLAIRTGTGLEYVGVERSPLPVELVRQLGYEAIEECQPAAGAMLRAIGEEPPEISGGAGSQRRRLGGPNGNTVQLDLFSGEVLDLPWGTLGRFHAIYQDPFSPEANPELWTEDHFRRLVPLLETGGALVTYCVKSEIQRRLRGLGLDVRAVPGPPGGKREVLLAIRRSPEPGAGA